MVIGSNLPRSSAEATRRKTPSQRIRREFRADETRAILSADRYRTTRGKPTGKRYRSRPVSWHKQPLAHEKQFTKYPHRNWRFINIFKSIPCYPRHPKLIAISECLMRYMRTIFMIQNAKSSVFFGVADEIIRQLSTNSQRAPVCELCAALYSIEHVMQAHTSSHRSHTQRN